MERIKQGYSQNTVRIKPEYGRKQTAGLEETAVSKTGWKAARQRMKEIILCRAVFLYAEKGMERGSVRKSRRAKSI